MQWTSMHIMRYVCTCNANVHMKDSVVAQLQSYAITIFYGQTVRRKIPSDTL